MFRKLQVSVMGAALVLAVLQITLGSIVRITGSGDACPDWPTCFGKIVPDFESYQIVLEWTHRTSGALLGVIIVLAVVLVLIDRKQRKGLTAISIIVGFILVSITGGIGAGVVLSELNPAIRALHLMLAELTVLFLAFGFVNLLKISKPTVFKRPNYSFSLGILSSTLVLLVLITGAYLVWKDWGVVCTSWPTCVQGGGIIPDSTATWTNMGHRIMTLFTFLVAGYSVHVLMRNALSRPVKILAITVLILFVTEILVGASIPMSLRFFEGGYDAIRVMHLLVATATWATLCVLTGFTLTSYIANKKNLNK